MDRLLRANADLRLQVAALAVREVDPVQVKVAAPLCLPGTVVCQERTLDVHDILNPNPAFNMKHRPF